MVMGFVSTYYLGKHKKRGFLLGLIGNLSWIAFGVISGSYASLAANVIYVVMNIQAWRKWDQDAKKCSC
ncbi:MAG: PnuC protein [Verrucomicrobiales bacterium]|nr:PnuC protein [Verrucomicrobiales bacterium]